MNKTDLMLAGDPYCVTCMCCILYCSSSRALGTESHEIGTLIGSFGEWNCAQRF